jgi:hypothetical protein
MNDNQSNRDQKRAGQQGDPSRPSAADAKRGDPDDQYAPVKDPSATSDASSSDAGTSGQTTAPAND